MRCLKEMEPAQTERANNPDADKVLADRTARCRDKVENAAGVARVKAAAGGRGQGQGQGRSGGGAGRGQNR